jgi:hypothetical protein
MPVVSMTEARAAERSRDNKAERTIVILWLKDVVSLPPADTIARSRSREQVAEAGNGGCFCCRRERFAAHPAASEAALLAS